MASTVLAQEQLKKVVELFSSEKLPGMMAQSKLIGVEKPSQKWSMLNQLTMMGQGTTDARGYRQWQNIGRHVKKGSKAIYILAPNMTKIKDEKTKEDKTVITGFRCIPVFKVEDTEGKQIEYVKNEPKMPELCEVAEAWNIQIRFEVVPGEYGHFSQGKNEIVLGTADEGVFFHELAHAAHKKIDGKLKGGQDKTQEIIAQLTAAVLGRIYGKNIDGQSQSYIGYYAKALKAVSYTHLTLPTKA